MTITRAELEARIRHTGLVPRGALALDQDERQGPLSDRRTLVLIGFAGRQGWDAFAASPEAGDGLPDALDRWSHRLIDALAQACDALPLYPFGGPPYWPFQRWGMRAEPLHSSPLGLLIHPEFGLWHSYRGALALNQDLAIAPLPDGQSPCVACAGQPCLSACPVGAFSVGDYAVDRCAEWLYQSAGEDCMAHGCLARRACPVGREHAHGPQQARFTMRAFRAAR